MAFRDSKVSLTAILSKEEISRAIAEFLMRRYQCSGTWQADLDWNFDVRLNQGLTQELAEQTVKGVEIVDVKVVMTKKKDTGE